MIRRQIQLSEADAARLADRARERGVSQAALVREAIELLLARDDEAARRSRIRSAIGRYHGGGEVSAGEQHDELLAEIYRS